MNDSRKKLSGAQNKQLRRERLIAEEKVLAKVPKLDTFFSSFSRPKPTQSDPKPGPSGIFNTNDKNEEEHIIEYFENTSDSATGKEMDYEVAVSSNNCSKPTSIITTTNKDENNKTVPLESVEENIQADRSSLSTLPSSRSNDPHHWLLNGTYINNLIRQGLNQNIPHSFEETKRPYKDGFRFLTKSMFEREMINGEKTTRSWLIYSQSSKKVFCGPCRLFDRNNSKLATEGFHDWKNGLARLQEHENSVAHKNCVLIFLARSQELSAVDKQITKQVEDEIDYWNEVLRRVISIIKKLCSRGLPLYGKDEKIGSNKNGNFLMCAELLAEYDPFLANHLTKYGGKGKGSTSYIITNYM